MEKAPDITFKIILEPYSMKDAEWEIAFEVFKVLVWKTRPPHKDAYKINYKNLKFKWVRITWPYGSQIPLPSNMLKRLEIFLNEEKLFLNEGIDCFLFWLFLEWKLSLGNIKEDEEGFKIFLPNVEINFSQIKWDISKDNTFDKLLQSLQPGEAILTLHQDSPNESQHISIYLWKWKWKWNWLFLGKFGNFPPTVYDLEQLNKVLEFNCAYRVSIKESNK